MSTTELQEEAHSHGGGKKEVIKVTIILTVITIVELILGFMMMDWAEGSFKRDFVKGVIIILMISKAYYIVGYFMHLIHENKIMKRLIMIPLLLFVWFIIAFLADGHSYLELRKKYDPYSVEMNEKKLPVDNQKEHQEHQEPAEQ
ncbi:MULTISPECIES: cytochrome C oxidase subunit IV family protein [Chitinophagaceae]